jgi:uncharacterized protein (TIGR00255 family)
MIKSMTGYGRAHQETSLFDITAEVKTLNSKYLDAGMKLPRLFGDREIEVRQLLSEVIQRGKVSLTIDFQGKGQLGGEPAVNQDLLKAYYHIYKKIAEEVNDPNPDLFRLAVQSPDVLLPPVQESADAETWQSVRQVIEEALHRCNQFRIQEGVALKRDFVAAIERIQSALEEVKKQIPARDQRLRDKLRKQVDENFGKEIDENRFEQELIYYLEKLDINEEIVRLTNHLEYFNEVLQQDNVHGKKLGFISQEIGREINTIGSKANDAQIQRHVVGMKEDLEKIKEQVLNVL